MAATEMVINIAEVLPGDFTRNADFSLPTERLKRAIVADAGREKTHFINATQAANVLFGNSVAANIFLVGYAYQLGAIPLSADSIAQAIELNGEAVEMNKAAFYWGRRAAADPAAVETLAKPEPANVSDARRLSHSSGRDGGAPCRVPYRLSECRIRGTLSARGSSEPRRPKRRALPARQAWPKRLRAILFKLMAYKDEYEVARLYSDGSFIKQVQNELGGERLRFHVHLAPPLLAPVNKVTGEPKKLTFGPWIFPVFKLLAQFRLLRGTSFDPFGHSRERQTERALIRDYEAMLEEVLAKLDPGNHHIAVGLAAIPEKIRGFGHVKLRHLHGRQGGRGRAARAIPGGTGAAAARRRVGLYVLRL